MAPKSNPDLPFIDPTPPTDTLSVLSSAEVADWGITAVGAPYAWRYTKGNGAKVAVLDTGIADHVDLPIGPRVAVRDDSFPEGKDTFEVDFGELAADHQGHGTHCAGIIAAVDNGVGVVGIAPYAHLIGIKVLRGQNGSGSYNDIATGIRVATAMGADVISLSLGSKATPPDDRLQKAVDEAVSKGVVIVAAAGNEYSKDGKDTVNFPAKCSGVIPVAAVDQAFAHAPFSSTGPDMARGVAMPGVKVYSTYLSGGYATLSGTSMATPMLAGFIALMLSYHGDGKLHKTPIPRWGTRERIDAVIEHLRGYVRPLGDSSVFGIGLPDGAKLGADGD